jgi:hypothetical protein
MWYTACRVIAAIYSLHTKYYKKKSYIVYIGPLAVRLNQLPNIAVIGDSSPTITVNIYTK